jgi:hypothetical protein
MSRDVIQDHWNRTPEQDRAIADAAVYALKSGCFFPAPPIQGRDTVETMIRKGALRHLHDVLAAQLAAGTERTDP